MRLAKVCDSYSGVFDKLAKGPEFIIEVKKTFVRCFKTNSYYTQYAIYDKNGSNGVVTSVQNRGFSWGKSTISLPYKCTCGEYRVNKKEDKYTCKHIEALKEWLKHEGQSVNDSFSGVMKRMGKSDSIALAGREFIKNLTKFVWFKSIFRENTSFNIYVTLVNEDHSVEDCIKDVQKLLEKLEKTYKVELIEKPFVENQVVWVS